EWLRDGFPESPPGGGKTVLVGGLQTVLEVMPDAGTSYEWLRKRILPLCRLWGNHWENVGLGFGMDGPGKRFNLDEADDVVYFGRGDQDARLCLTRAIWNGAATGSGVFKLMVDGTKDIGGFHVIRIS